MPFLNCPSAAGLQYSDSVPVFIICVQANTAAWDMGAVLERSLAIQWMHAARYVHRRAGRMCFETCMPLAQDLCVVSVLSLLGHGSIIVSSDPYLWSLCTTPKHPSYAMLVYLLLTHLLPDLSASSAEPRPWSTAS